MGQFKELQRQVVMRDPIHGYIYVDFQIIKDLIDTYEFQRLRRTHQLGGAYQVYHTAEHSRFSHSLGVYEIVRRMCTEVSDIKGELNDYEKVCVQCAALLHDIGHGPFSHAFEFITHISHEEYTRRIIMEDTEINRILKSYDSRLPKDVADIISHDHPKVLLTQMISGQLDADRMDYLLRDSYFTGTSYGEFDLERILRSLRVHEGKLVIKDAGMHTIEDYIMSRYHMYWQVYYHPVSRCFENMVRMLFERLKDLYAEGKLDTTRYGMFVPFISGEPTDLQEYIKFDEAGAYYGISLLRDSDDPICKDLADRILSRRLFKAEPYVDDAMKDAKIKEIEKRGFNPKYYFAIDETVQIPYKPYGNTEPIYVILKDDTIQELSESSVIVAAIVKGDVKDDKRMYFPK